MKAKVQNAIAKLAQPRLLLIMFLGFLLLLAYSNSHARDLLAGTDDDVVDTIKGGAKRWLIWIDAGVSLAAFAATKKWVVFFSVLGISLFISALIKFNASA